MVETVPESAHHNGVETGAGSSTTIHHESQNRERPCSLPPWNDPLHLAEGLWWLRLTSTLLGPNPALPQVEKEWINVWRADWVTVGSHQRSHSSQQWNAISPMAPCHYRGQNVYWREVSNLKVICTFQKMAALTLINNRLAQLKPCWSR